MGQPDIDALIAGIDRTLRRLYALLRSHDARTLAARPPSGDWSAIEHVRHLLFAEQLHLGQFLPEGAAWTPMRLGARGRRVAVRGGEVTIRRDGRQIAVERPGPGPNDDLENALLAWDAIHRPIRRALNLAGGDDARIALERNAGHLARHVAAIEKLLRKAGG